MVRRVFVVAPNLIGADKTSRKWAESAVRSVLRCHQLCENRPRRRVFRSSLAELQMEKDSMAERGGFEPPVPLAFIRVAFGPSLAPYSGAERNPFKLQTYSDCRLASNPILLISIGRPGVEASRDRDTSTEQRGTRHYVVVWFVQNSVP